MAEGPRKISLDELSQHSSAASCWIVVDSYVYDVTRMIQKDQHPGGADILLELAGKDASRAFAAIGHSAAAKRLMLSQLIGILEEGASRSLRAARALLKGAEELSEESGSAASSPEPPARKFLQVPLPTADPEHQESPRTAQSAGVHGRPLKAGMNHVAPHASEALWSTRCRGFLPVRDPVVELSEPYGVLMELVAQLPSSLAEGTFRQLVENAAPRFAPIKAAIHAECSVDVLERVHSLYGYVGKGYVHRVNDADGAQSVPKFLSAGWVAVSEKLGRHPTIDYADCVLVRPVGSGASGIWARGIRNHVPPLPCRPRPPALSAGCPAAGSATGSGWILTLGSSRKISGCSIVSPGC
jgi:hypothetical protein